jgi:DNA-binding beta-propeller fold protein YncE
LKKTFLMSASVSWLVLSTACGGAQPDVAPPVTAAAQSPASPAGAAASAPRGIPLPGGEAGNVSMDYLACDRATGRVWVPAGGTGSVDVIEPTGDKVTRIQGFPTSEMERNGKKRIVGPSAATLGDGVAYIGSRGDSSICAVNAGTLQRGACVILESMPDGLAYVPSVKELWATTPRDKSITILDVSNPSAPKVKTKITLEGEPEGYAVDDARGIFYTNLEDKDRTLAIDFRSRKVVSTWKPECGEDGPKGLALDRAKNFLLVACPDHILALDAGHEGKLLSKIDTGDGVDNIDYLETRHELYVGAGKAAKLTIAGLDPAGALTAVAVIPTAKGARNAVVDADGNAYLTDSAGGRILAVASAHKAR